MQEGLQITGLASLLSKLTSIVSDLHTTAVDGGRSHEQQAVSAYAVAVSLATGLHCSVLPVGFIGLVDEPWLGATPRGYCLGYSA